MAKRVVKWSVDGSILKMSKHLEDPKAVAEIKAEFDLKAFFPGFAEFNDAQQQGIIYMTKQKLMDVGANEIANLDGKVTAAKKKWAELLAGKWEGERVNGTGAAENKRVIAEVKKASEAVTLQGLLIKQTLYPDKFTEEDAKKLAEFMEVMVKQQAKAKK